MIEPETTKIVFPCDYPIKVIGDTRAEFHQNVYDIVLKHDPTVTTDRVSQRTSRKGNFISISIILWVKSPEQLEGLFNDLKELDSVRMVL